MKQLLISFGTGLLLLCIWGVIVVVTSQDFAHEGPNSVWASPVEAWSRFLIHVGWSERVLSRIPLPQVVLGVTMPLGPFVVALSAVAHMTIWLLRRIARRKT